MAKAATPDWILNENWAIGRDSQNWIIYKRSGRNWRPNGYYPNLEQVFQSFHQLLTRTEPPDVDLLKFIGQCFDLTQAAASLFNEHIATLAFSAVESPLPAAHNSLSENLAKGVNRAP